MTSKNKFGAKAGPVFTAAIFCFLSTFQSTRAHANILGLFPAGASCKSAAMESAGDCTEGQTLLYNPAIMTRIKPGFSGEAGVGRLEYSYEHPVFDPVQVSVVTPMFSEGWKGLLADNRLSWGFTVMPSSAADLDIKGLPRRVEGNSESLNVKASRKQFHFALGGSYHFPELDLSAGLSLIYTYDHRALKGAEVTNPSTTLVDMKGTGHFIRAVIGSSWQVGQQLAAVSYMLPLTKKFTGKTRIAGESAAFNTEQVDYDPGMLLTHFRTDWNAFTVSANVNRIFGAKGRNIQRDGINRRTEEADLKDVNHVGARIGFNAGEYGAFAAGFAYLDSYWGDGYYYKDAEGIPHHEVGHLFGQFNGIPVRNQSIVWTKDFGAWNTQSALFRSAGTTTVSGDGDNPGHYQIEFVSLTCSIRRAI